MVVLKKQVYYLAVYFCQNWLYSMENWLKKVYYLAVYLGTVHLLRKGQRVGSWLGKTLIFPYMGGYIVQDDPYVSISFQELCQINCLANSNLTNLVWFLTNILIGKLKTNVLEYTSSFCKIDVDFCKPGYFKKVSSKAGSIDIMKER